MSDLNDPFRPDRLEDKVPTSNVLLPGCRPVGLQVVSARNRHFGPASLQANYNNGFIGCFVNDSEAPSWAQDIAGQEAARLRDTPVWAGAAETQLVNQKLALTGKGKRAVNFNHYRRLDPSNALIFMQNYGNCTMASCAELCGSVISSDQLGEGKPLAYLAKVGTAVPYGFRGHSGQGSSLETAAWVHTTIGTQLRIVYELGSQKWDFRDEDKDESYGNAWGRSGPPKALVDHLKSGQRRFSKVHSISEEGAVLDALFNFGAIHVGSTRTAMNSGDPVTYRLQSANHAEYLMGYDDTDEFREFYEQRTGKKLTSWVGIWNQTWGNWNKVTNWPDHLWGPRPEGAFVLTAEDTMKKVRQTAYVYTDSEGFHPRDVTDWNIVFSPEHPMGR